MNFHQTYNRTMLELKFESKSFKDGLSLAYNRTMLELKFC